MMRLVKKNQSPKRRKNRRKGDLLPCKSEDFLSDLKKGNPMVEYMTNLHIMSSQASNPNPGNSPKEGGYVSIAHFREEFNAPRLNKGKSVSSKNRWKKGKRG